MFEEDLAEGAVLEAALAALAILISIIGVIYAPEQIQKAARAYLHRSRKVIRKSVLENVKSTRVLRVGCLWYPPFVEYEISPGSVSAKGYYPEILTAFAESQGIQIEYSVLQWHGAISAVLNGDVDVVACVLKSAERREHCEFVGTVFRVGVGAVVKATQAKIVRHGDLTRSDVRVAVTRGEIGHTYATENLGLAKDEAGAGRRVQRNSQDRFTVVTGSNIKAMMSMVANGDVDCALADSLSCAQFVEQSGGALVDIFKSTPIHVEDNALMIAKGNPEFADWLESGIGEIRKLPETRTRESMIESRYSGILHGAYSSI